MIITIYFQNYNHTFDFEEYVSILQTSSSVIVKITVKIFKVIVKLKRMVVNKSNLKTYDKSMVPKVIVNSIECVRIHNHQRWYLTN